jgi:hypothetical protein
MSYAIIVAMMPSADLMCKSLNPSDFAVFGRDNPCVNNYGAVIETVYKVKSQSETISGISNYLKSMMGLLFLQALFYPLASLIITITFIRQTGSLFGADLAEIGRGLIKLI